MRKRNEDKNAENRVHLSKYVQITRREWVLPEIARKTCEDTILVEFPLNFIIAVKRRTQVHRVRRVGA